jgi:hypothetical protein
MLALLTVKLNLEILARRTQEPKGAGRYKMQYYAAAHLTGPK